MERSTYFVERYWPGTTADAHAAAVARGRRTAAAMRREGQDIEYVKSTLVPEQETVFCLFEAVSEELVAELNDRARFHYDRIHIALTDTREEART
jgi:hypothetical protein